MADIEKDKKATDALEAEASGAMEGAAEVEPENAGGSLSEGEIGDAIGDAFEERKAQPTVGDLMKNAAAALGDFDDEVPSTSVVAAPVVTEESAVEADIEVEAQTEKKSRRKGKAAKAKLAEEADVSALAAAAAEAMSDVQVEELVARAEAQPEEALEAFESLDALVPETQTETETESGVEAKSDEGGRKGKGKKKKAESKTEKKSKKKSAENLEWQAETRDLDFVEESGREADLDAAEMAASDALLAEMIAAEADSFENGDGEAEDTAEMSASDAILAEMGAPSEASEEEVAAEAREDVSFEAASESSEQEALQTAAGETSEPMDQLEMGAMEEELDSAENDASPEPVEFIEHDQLVSIIESLLFSTDKPVSIATIKQIFKGSNIRTKDITRALDLLASEYASPVRGVSLEEINGGYQLRTKVDNADYLRRLAKTRPFRLSGPALEVMAIVAYKQPITKHEIDEIRGVESGHLLRALMERNLVSFSGKAENLPGKPMTYSSTRKFLEIFGLRNLKELPTLSEIDELIPEGIGEVEEKETLSELTDRLSTELTASYSEGEDELLKINDQLQQIDTTSEFFEQEKQRERERKERERAQDIREKLVLGDQVDEKDRRWLDRYETRLQEIEAAAQAGQTMTIPAEEVGAAPEVGAELQALSEEAAQSAEAHAESAASEDDLSDVDPALFDDGDGYGEDDLAANVDWEEDK